MAIVRLILIFLLSISIQSCLKSSSSNLQYASEIDKSLYGYISKEDGREYICKYEIYDNSVLNTFYSLIESPSNSNLANIINAMKNTNSKISIEDLEHLINVQYKLDSTNICTIDKTYDKKLLQISTSIQNKIANITPIKNKDITPWKQYFNSLDKQDILYNPKEQTYLYKKNINNFTKLPECLTNNQLIQFIIKYTNEKKYKKNLIQKLFQLEPNTNDNNKTVNDCIVLNDLQCYSLTSELPTNMDLSGETKYPALCHYFNEPILSYTSYPNNSESR